MTSLASEAPTARPNLPAGRDAIVVGSGPNGLAAALTLARAGRSVLVVEAESTIGGGCRTAELTIPGFHHDVCSAFHPLAKASPVFRRFDLDRYGLEWAEPEIQLAHPLDDGSAGLVYRSIDRTAAGLGEDGREYARTIGWLARDWDHVVRQFLGPLHIPRTVPDALFAARFGPLAIQPANLFVRRFRTPAARALLGGCAAHSFLKLNEPATTAYGLLLLVGAHAVGWPVVRGGSAALVEAMATELRELGGTIVTDWRVASLDELPAHGAAILDLVPRGVLAVAGDRLRRTPGGRVYAAELERYRYGPAAFKLDIALDGGIPWRNADSRRAGAVHVGGTFEEIFHSESEVVRGRVSRRPFVLVGQQAVADPSRAPEGKSTVWAYCHVPNGSTADMTEPILSQIERFAPGFRERILAMHVSTPADLEARNANCIGGDINGGREDLTQLFTRPAIRFDPYSTPDPRIFIGSSSTPPGGGVHGIPGWYAAQSALRGVLR